MFYMCKVFYPNKKIYFSQNAKSAALYFKDEVVCGLYKENNPTTFK